MEFTTCSRSCLVRLLQLKTTKEHINVIFHNLFYHNRLSDSDYYITDNLIQNTHTKSKHLQKYAYLSQKTMGLKVI